MRSFATKQDRFEEFGLSQDQFITAYEIAKLRFQAQTDNPRPADADVLRHLNIHKDASIISKIKAGHPARDITKRLLEFIKAFAPEELPSAVHRTMAGWNQPDNKSLEVG